LRTDDPQHVSSLAPPRVVAPAAPRDLVALAEPPTFSVVVPVYEGADTVGQAIESLLAQTVAPFEIIVCDDGSTDDLAGALVPYGDRITLLHQPHSGLGAARNLGSFHAGGEFVATCDADDEVLPRLIEALGELAMARPDLDILCRTSFLERDGTPAGLSRTYENPKFPVDDQRKGILGGAFIPSSSAFRRQRLVEVGGFDESLRCAEDYDLWMRLIFSGAKAGLLLEPLGIYRLHGGSLSTRGVWCRQGEISTFTKLLDRNDLSEDERRIAEERIAQLGRELKREEAREALAQGRPDARRLSLGVALGKGQRLQTRVRAAVAVAVPRWAGRQLRT